jgi:hypothetical protein
MMTKLEKPIWMTVDEADKKYYPNKYIMINCEVDTGLAIAGEVVAYASPKNGEFSDYKHQLAQSGQCGEMYVGITKDPLDGGSLLVEYYDVN